MASLTLNNDSCSTPPVEVSGDSHHFAQVLINRMGAFKSPNGYESYCQLPHGIGFGTVRKFDLQNELSVEVFDQHFHENQSSKFNLTYKSLRFVFFIHGVGHLKVLSPYSKTKSTVDQAINGCCSLGYFPELEGGFQIKKDCRYVQVTINISPSIIKSILTDQFEGIPKQIHEIIEGVEDVGYYHIAPISRPIYSTLYELLFCQYTGAARKMFIESKALELVAHKFSQIQTERIGTIAESIIGNKDTDKIYEAEYLLSHNLECPPLLNELARCVGMSPKKLNTGFRKVFGTTVFGHLQRIRLERARYLMEKQGKNVTEAALAVGYNSVPSFSQAFSRHFSIQPRKCMKT